MSTSNDGAKILVVDDDPDILAATAHVLRKAGHEVVLAQSGAEALQLAVESLPDVILADVVMPAMDGAEFCRRVKATPQLAATFVVLLSGERTASMAQAEGLEAGADGYIARPISNRELVARVEAMLRIKRAENERDRVIAELREALAKIKTLTGIIPICMHCRKIRDDAGYWQKVEVFFTSHTEAEFSHGLCAECLEEHYPDCKPVVR
jgi:DNA-binding response OmpR family regulator